MSKEKAFLEKYPEFKEMFKMELKKEGKKEYGNKLNLHIHFTLKKFGEVLDKHFVRKEDYEESIKDFEVLSKGALKDVTECKEKHIDKQKVKDAIEILKQMEKQNQTGNKYDKQRVSAFSDAIKVLKRELDLK